MALGAKVTNLFDEKEARRFCRALDESHQWPCEYTFKFIAPQDKVDELLQALDNPEDAMRRESSGGKYVSLTLRRRLTRGEEAVMMYRKAAVVQGVMAL